MLEQAPVGLREPLQESAHLQVVAGQGADLGNQFLADIFGDRLLIHLGGEVITALGGVLVEGSLEEIKGLEDLALELLLAELEEFGLFANKYAYIYAYYRAS